MLAKGPIIDMDTRDTSNKLLPDLVFTNNPDIITAVSEADWPDFTDHKVVSAQTSFRIARDIREKEEQHLCNTGKRYKALDFNKAPWEKIREGLAQVDWSEMEEIAKASPTTSLTWFHDKVLDILEVHVPKKVPRNKKNRSKMRKTLWKKHAKAKSQVRSASTIHKVSQALQNVWKVGRQLAEDYMASNTLEEDQAVLSMKQDPKKFFSFARSKQKTKAGVGPFLENGKPNPSPDFAAEQL